MKLKLTKEWAGHSVGEEVELDEGLSKKLVDLEIAKKIRKSIIPKPTGDRGVSKVSVKK